MTDIFERIWQLALPYQDRRDDPGHAEITLYYATSLAESEQGNPDVIIPAMILHDVGWSQVSRERWLFVFHKSKTDEQRREVQIEHQNAGVMLAKEILEKAEYPAQLAPEILEIISQHDTRKGFISRNEGLVRDSDKLWRFSKECFEAGVKRSKTSPEERCKDLEASIDKPDYFYSERAKELAREQLQARRRELLA